MMMMMVDVGFNKPPLPPPRRSVLWCRVNIELQSACTVLNCTTHEPTTHTHRCQVSVFLCIR